MKQEEFITAVAQATQKSKSLVKEIIDAMATKIYSHEVIQDDKGVRISGFGTFKWKLVPERKARNPKTGETVVVPERLMLKFKPVGK